MGRAYLAGIRELSYRLCVGLAVVVIAGACVVSLGATRTLNGQDVVNAKSVRAESFIVVGKDGKEWIKLNASDTGKGAVIRFLYGDSTCAAINVTDKGSSLILRGVGESKSRLILEAAEKGTVITFEDEKGNSRGIIDVSKDGMGMKFFDAGGADRGELYFSDSADGMKLYDKQGKLVWKAPK